MGRGSWHESHQELVLVVVVVVAGLRRTVDRRLRSSSHCLNDDVAESVSREERTGSVTLGLAIEEGLAMKALRRKRKSEGLKSCRICASPLSLAKGSRQVVTVLAAPGPHSMPVEVARTFYDTILSGFTYQGHPCADLLTGLSMCYSGSGSRSLGCCPASQGPVSHPAGLGPAANLPFPQHPHRCLSVRTGHSGKGPRFAGCAEGCLSARPSQSPVL